MKLEIISMMPNIENHLNDKKAHLEPKKLINIRPLINNKTNLITIDINLTEPMILLDKDRCVVRNQHLFIKNVFEVITKNYSNPLFRRPHLAARLHVSERQLHRKTCDLINKTPMDIIREYRLERAFIEILKGHQIGKTGFDCGFNSSSYFSQCFKKRFLITPKQLQNYNSYIN